MFINEIWVEANLTNIDIDIWILMRYKKFRYCPLLATFHFTPWIWSWQPLFRRAHSREYFANFGRQRKFRKTVSPDKWDHRAHGVNFVAKFGGANIWNLEAKPFRIWRQTHFKFGGATSLGSVDKGVTDILPSPFYNSRILTLPNASSPNSS